VEIPTSPCTGGILKPPAQPEQGITAVKLTPRYTSVAGLTQCARRRSQVSSSASPANHHLASPFAGSVPAEIVPGILSLSLRDAIDRGLKQNLGLLLSNADIRSARRTALGTIERSPVARSNIDLAEETLTQSRDRFGAGVTDTMEVAQSQEAVASAHEQDISSLYNYNYAKISLARALGIAEAGVKEYFRGK
jgi:hypothetical protein